MTVGSSSTRPSLIVTNTNTSIVPRAHTNTHTLTNCSRQTTSSVHLASHFPILEGSGRGLEPRRLRGNDGSPVRSRLAGRTGSHHPGLGGPVQRLLLFLLLLLVRLHGPSTHSGWPILLQSGRSREVLGEVGEKRVRMRWWGGGALLCKMGGGPST